MRLHVDETIRNRTHGDAPVGIFVVNLTGALLLGILTGADLRDRPLPFLQAHFGSYADYLYAAARGEDHRPVRAHREAKSVGAERTFETNLSARDDLHAALARVAEAFPPSRPPVRDGAWFSGWPRPLPDFLPPPMVHRSGEPGRLQCSGTEAMAIAVFAPQPWLFALRLRQISVA